MARARLKKATIIKIQYIAISIIVIVVSVTALVWLTVTN